MDFKLVEKKENALLERTEVDADVSFSDATPPTQKMRELVVQKLGCNPDLMVISSTRPRFGQKAVSLRVHVYKSPEQMKRVEEEHILKRNSLVEEKAGAEAPKEEKKEASREEAPKEVKGEKKEGEKEAPKEEKEGEAGKEEKKDAPKVEVKEEKKEAPKEEKKEEAPKEAKVEKKEEAPKGGEGEEKAEKEAPKEAEAPKEEKK